MEHRVLKTFPSTVPLFSLFLTKVSFPFSHHMFFDEGPWTPEETWQDQECCMTLDQECCILSWVHNVANPTVKGKEGTLFGPSFPLQCLCTFVRILGSSCPVQGPPAPREPQPHLVSLIVCSGTYKSGTFPFQVSLAQACAWVIFHSWDHGTALTICLFKRWIWKEETHQKKKMLWKSSCLEGNPCISKYRKHQNKRARIVNI